MYAVKRQQQIIELLVEHSGVNVKDLAHHFDVSAATIRRDLSILEEQGLLQRTYGGALPPARVLREASFYERRHAYTEEKKRIGKAAAELVRPGDTIFIDGGTTTEHMASHLIANKAGLTVVTNGHNIVTELMGHPPITLISIGGALDQRSLTFVGVLAQASLDSYHMRFDKTFVAAGGITAHHGITNVSLEEIPIKRAAIASSRQVILVVDSSKFGVCALALITSITRIHRIITDTGAPISEIRAIRDQGVIVDLV
jgi:DeoR/GlpR family transcriptional regulator of sugar metabolism